MAKQIRALTGVRGLAALAVVIYHIHAQHDAPWFKDMKGVLWDVMLHGYLAVDLFFVLSGFVMALSYGNFSRDGWTKRNYGIFLMRRFGRVYPLYAFVLCVIAVPILLGLSHSTEITGKGLLMNLALIQSWGFGDSINPFSWSISTEFAAYLLFPLLTLLTFKGGWTQMAAVCAVAFATICMISLTQTPPEVDARDGPLDIFWVPGQLPLLRCLGEFTFGLATYRLSLDATVRRWMGHTTAACLVTIFILVALLLPHADVLLVLLMPALLLVLASGDNFAARVMGSRVAFFLGEISYSLYLVHGPLLRIRRILGAKLALHMSDKMADIIALGVFYSSSILLSWLTYRLLEKPCRRWVRQLEEKLFQYRGPASNAAMA
jgi:peptidoglycan/LPS O-acetylase OafA/YrhL